MSDMQHTVALVLHFRHAEATLRCLHSLASDGIFDVLLVDNSADGGVSLRQLELFVHSQLSGMHLYIKEPGVNLGFAKGVNFGLRLLRVSHPASPVLLINSDAELVSGAHERLRGCIQRNIAIAAPAIDGPTGLVSAVVYYAHMSGLLHAAPPRSAHHRLLGGCCLMVHPQLCTNDLFDEAFFFYGDDIDLGYRMSIAGIQMIDGSPAVVRHEGSASSRNGSLFYEYHIARAHLLLARKIGQSCMARALFIGSRWVNLSARATLRAFRFGSLNAWYGLLLARADISCGRCRDLMPPS